jgi:predicted PurR-regulated permease PerM
MSSARRRGRVRRDQLEQQKAAGTKPQVKRVIQRPGKREPNALEVAWQNVWVRAATFIVLIILAALLLWHARSGYTFALTVALVGYLLAYILNPLVNFLQRLRIGRPLAVGIVYLLLANLVVIGSVLIGQVVAQMGEFLRLIPAAIDSLQPYLLNLLSWVEGLPALLERFGAEPDPEFAEESVALITPVFETGQQMIADFLAEAVTTLRGLLQRLLSEGSDFLFSGVVSIVSGGVQVFFIILISAYFLYDFPRFSQALLRYVPVRYRSVFVDVRDKTDKVVGGFLRGQVLINLLIGLTLWAGLTIAQVPLALSLSFFAAVFNIIPYLGPIISTVPAVLLALTVSPWSAVGALAVFIIANQLEAHVYAPLVLGKTTNLHPVTVIISILVGVGLFGIIGAFLAIPVVALTKVLLEEYLLHRPDYTEPVEEGLLSDGE